MPCGSGGEVGIAIVAPPPSPAHDEGVVTPGPHGVSIEHQRIMIAICGGSQHRTVHCGSHVTYYPKKGGKPGGRFEATCWQTWKHGIRCRVTRTSVGFRGQNEARGRRAGLLAAWLACAVFPKMQTNMPPRCRSCALTNEQNIGTPMLLSRTSGPRHEQLLREGETLEPRTSAEVACPRGYFCVWPFHVHKGSQCLQRREDLNK